jgi:hypothetical protein
MAGARMGCSQMIRSVLLEYCDHFLGLDSTDFHFTGDQSLMYPLCQGLDEFVTTYSTETVAGTTYRQFQSSQLASICSTYTTLTLE